ncbi:DUF4962 domain-containing protein [Marinilongibacter aquaticus]|uniref:DUF4962 domain-containing protein n=1 Tax=Marinilongibacter aquaticus TaxID=2975157 RepID=UPI0021BD488F|nr:DUF4962 domain-containing protein [Marinilongibacter aquaticus]UBM58699.1 DUF4962 domain-containing protein [Marinilongibacter aquaticus]
MIIISPDKGQTISTFVSNPTYLIFAIILSTIQATWGQYQSPEVSVIYPKNRIWAEPSGGEMAISNSPSLQWPTKKNVTYQVRLSNSSDFQENLIEKKGLIYGIFNPHRQMQVGTWYWQYKPENGEWSGLNHFRISERSYDFQSLTSSEIIARIPKEHPRVLTYKENIENLRQKAKNYPETENLIDEADDFMMLEIPTENKLIPEAEGRNSFEDRKLGILASKKYGWQVFTVLKTFSEAYVLTGDEKYYQQARKWIIEACKWDPEGYSQVSDFGDSGIMAGLAIALDTFWDKIPNKEKEGMITSISARANGFYKKWLGNVETRSSAMHVWQHILHRLLQSSLALVGETPDAEKWFAYIYDLWIAQNPKMGAEDGAWFNGTGYFRMNTVTIYDAASIFEALSGLNYHTHPWFKNNPKWLLYAFPPNSIADGFCNNGDRLQRPSIGYAGYADAASRMLKDPYAAWYAHEVAKGLNSDIASDQEFRWFRITRGDEMQAPDPVKDFKMPQAAVFPDVGVAYMHTNLQQASKNLMLSIRSSPFGSLAHTHADQNSFNIAYGGKRLFYNSGYRPAMGDPHFLGWYKHTQGHNAILIDGKGQPYNAGAYGLIPKFLHGKQISYALGDASNAYSGYDQGENVNLGVKSFRRHYLILRPDIIVIYDDLESDHQAEWTWLLHNDFGFSLNEQKNGVLAKNDLVQARLSLFSSSDIHFSISNEFSIPVDNWTNKLDEDGEPLDFKDQWHFKGSSNENQSKMRFLAIFQIDTENNPSPVQTLRKGTYSVGDWEISAEMDINRNALLSVRKKDGTAAFTSSGPLKTDESTHDNANAKIFETIDRKPIYKESADEVPTAIQNAILRAKSHEKH